VNLLKAFWTLLTVLGPAPVKPPPAEAGPSSGHGMFDAPDGDEDEAEAAPEATADEEADAGEEPEAVEPEEAAEAADEDADEDEDEEEEAEETEDEDEDEDEEEDDDAAIALRASHRARLQASAGQYAPATPRIALDSVKIRDAARKRFAELQGDESGKSDADAIAEIVKDVAIQILGSYHDGFTAPAVDRMEKAARNAQVGGALASFRKDVGEALTPAIEKRMAKEYLDFAETHGWRAADSIPLRDLFRMAGGKVAGKRGKVSGAAKAEAKARKQKEAALAAASGPRPIGRTTPKGERKPKGDDKVRAETARSLIAQRPFFQMG
jgi:hypothetical protein